MPSGDDDEIVARCEPLLLFGEAFAGKLFLAELFFAEVFLAKIFFVGVCLAGVLAGRDFLECRT